MVGGWWAHTPCPHTLSPHFVPTLCRVTGHGGPAQREWPGGAGLGAERFPVLVLVLVLENPALPNLPVLPELPPGGASVCLPAAPRTSRRSSLPADRPVPPPIRKLGHPAWRTTCASGFDCAAPAALFFPPPAAADARGGDAASTTAMSHCRHGSHYAVSAHRPAAPGDHRQYR